MQHTVLILLLLLISSSGICWAASIVVSGSWAETIDASDLQAGAGSDLIGTYESSANEVRIRITASANWQVDVRKSDTTWHANFQLYVRRTSDGTGKGSVSGGTTYQEVTTTDQSFFTGDQNRNNVDVQLRLTGVSVQIPPNTYTTTVNYTITDI